MRNRQVGRGLLVAMSLVVLASTAKGQQAPAEPEQALEEIVVTASRIPEALSNASAT